MCRHMGLKKGQAWGRGEASSLCEMRQTIFNMGVVWSEIRTLYWWLLPQVKDFLAFKGFHT
jgi:hypothetical protein